MYRINQIKSTLRSKEFSIKPVSGYQTFGSHMANCDSGRFVLGVINAGSGTTSILKTVN